MPLVVACNNIFSGEHAMIYYMSGVQCLSWLSVRLWMEGLLV